MVSKNTLYMSRKLQKGTMFLTLYVDDILLAGNNIEMIQATKEWLSSVFEIEDMGEARYVLGIEIIQNHSKRILGVS